MVVGEEQEVEVSFHPVVFGRYRERREEVELTDVQLRKLHKAHMVATARTSIASSHFRKKRHTAI